MELMKLNIDTEKKFCPDCGASLEQVLSGKFNEYTGQESPVKRCPRWWCRNRVWVIGGIIWGGIVAVFYYLLEL
jgi:uncharacterized protein with PIN domain